MKAYKFVKSAHVDAFEAGEEIRVGTFGAFRQLESGRQDDSEGYMGYHLEGLGFSNSPQEDSARRAITRLFGKNALAGLLPGQDTNVVMQNVTILRPAPFRFIFCTSVSPEAEAKGGEEHLFEITDLELFAYRITKAASDVLAPDFQISEVSYGKTLSDPLVEDAKFNPFVKGPAFASEQEVRVVWKPIRPGQAFNVRAPRAAKLLRRLR